MNFSQKVTKSLDDKFEQIIIVDHPDEFVLSNLEHAVVILHATWSLPSVKVIREYAKAFNRIFRTLDPFVKLYILNIDAVTYDFLKSLPGRLGGNGETFLVKNGIIKHNIPHYLESFEDEVIKCFRAGNY